MGEIWKKVLHSSRFAVEQSGTQERPRNLIKPCKLST